MSAISIACLNSTEDLFIGVPAVIGKNGIEKILPLKLTASEKEQFEKSVAAVKKTNEVLYEIGALTK